MELRMIPGSNPVSMIEPVSCASGRSIDWRREIAEKFKMDDSSLMVPLSDKAHNACCCKCT